MTDFDIRPGGVDPGRVERLARRVERTLAGKDNLTSDEVLKELESVVGSPVIQGYDIQQVVDAAEAWAKSLSNIRVFDVVFRGYNRDQVMALQEMIEAGEASADEVREAAFDVVMRGYDREQVDAAVEEWAAMLDDDPET